MLIFPVIIILITAVITRMITKSWLSPAAFFSFWWSFFIIAPLFFAFDFQIDFLGLWFITIFTMSLSAGSILAYQTNDNNLNNLIKLNLKINIKLLFTWNILFTAISFLGIYFLFQFSLNFYNTGAYNKGWLAIPNLIAVDRYGGFLDYPIIIKYSLYFIYPSNLLGGLLFGLKIFPRKNNLLLLLPLIASLLLGIIEGARTSILLGAILFYSGWLSSSIIGGEYSNKKLSYSKIFFSSSIIIGSFGIFFVLIQWLRQGLDNIVIDLLIERIRAYFFGYLAAFTQWFGEPIIVNNSFGFITFAGPFNLVGIMDRPLGFYEPIIIGRNISTNIFTAFRGIITDFSISGSIIIAFLIGFVMQSIFQKKNNLSLFLTLPISMFYAFTLYSPLISIFHYNSIIFSWFIIFILLIISKNESINNYSKLR